MRNVRQNNWTRVLLGLVLGAATIAAYQSVWHAGYIWDDDLYLTENPLLTAPDGLWRIWFSLESPSQYFPLTYTFFRFEHAFWGFDPAGYHWVNIILHAVNAVILWRLLRSLKISGAWFAAALFALHPVQVESVAWITELKNLLMGFFFLLSLICWVRFLDERSRARLAFYLAALLFFALALTAKTTACTLPAALLLLLWWQRKPITRARLAQIFPFLIFGAGMGAITIWWERFHQGTQGHAFSVSPLDRLLLASRATWFYLGKLLWPHPLIFSYPRWSISSANPADYSWLAALIAAAAAIWFLRRRFGRGVESALLFFVATLSPVLGFIMLWTFRYSWVADHYQYLACIGPIALFAAAFEQARTRFGRVGNWSAVIIGGLLLLSLGKLTWSQGLIYRDAETLWRATIADNPKSALAHNSLGVLIAKNGSVEAELAEYKKAVEGDPTDAEAHGNLGFALAQLGRTEEAMAEYKESIALDPRYPKAHGNLAQLLLGLGRLDEAVVQLRALLEMDPRNAPLQHSLGDILAGQGEAEEALEHWKRALALDPKDASLQGLVGRSLSQSGRAGEGLPYLRRAAEFAPENAEAHYNYATALSLLGRCREAIPEYRAALRLEPTLAEAPTNLANCYVQTDQFPEAISAFESALKLQPDQPAIHKNLALLLRALGRNAEAEAHEKRAAELEQPRN